MKLKEIKEYIYIYIYTHTGHKLLEKKIGTKIK